MTNLIKFARTLWLLLIVIAFSLHASAQQKPRTDELFNFDWKFSIGNDAGAQSPAFNDSKWKPVQLPHDASIAGAFDTVSGSRQNGFRPRHIGWYRKTFTLPANVAHQVVSIEFEGVYRDAEVWLNGTKLGRHLNGYTGFSYDITRFLKQDKPNVVAVRYDNTYKQSSRWYTGEGIYRNVWLHFYQPLHIAENGVYITTPDITGNHAKAVIQTEVSNQTDSLTLTTLRSEIISPTGEVAGTQISVVPVPAHKNYTFSQEALIANPVLWDLASCKMYTVKSYLINGNHTTDVTTTRFGIRSVTFTPEQGFLLNGKKVFLNGVNIHHDLGPLGAAAFDKGFKRRLLGLKKMGVNALRLAHNPHSKAVLDICDDLGILVFDESFDKWSSEYYGPGQDFNQHWQADLDWFIRRDRNHPSVFIWSVGNEVAVKQQYKDSAFVVQLTKMMDVVNRLDPSRKVTSGLYPSRDEDTPAPMAFYMDVVSDNYMARFYKRDHPKFPQLIFLESEMTTDNGGENFFNYDHSYACGQFYWGGTDYIGESYGWPSKGWNGIIDWCDNWKPISYYIKSFYSAEPMIKIAVFNAAQSESRIWNDVSINNLKMTDSWNWQPGQKLTLYTFTNGDEVELFINNRSVGVKKLRDFPKNKILWELNYEPGQIKAVARKDGKEIATDEIKTAGAPDRIIMKTDSNHIVANGLDLAYINVTVVDKNGILVPDAANKIHFDIAGVGDNVGVANGDRLSNELFVADDRKVYQGKCLLVVRSRRTPGKIKITAKSAGLKTAAMDIDATRYE